MRILMLGWEFPPFIAGGLGTACYGLTKALDRLGHEVVFVLPRPVDRSHASHVRLLSPEAIRGINVPVGGPVAGAPGAPGAAAAAAGAAMVGGAAYTMPGFEHAVFRSVPAGEGMTSVYPKFDQALPGGGVPGAVTGTGGQIIIDGQVYADPAAMSDPVAVAMGGISGHRVGAGGGAGAGRERLSPAGRRRSAADSISFSGSGP